MHRGAMAGTVTNLRDWNAQIAASLWSFSMTKGAGSFQGYVRGRRLREAAFVSMRSAPHTAVRQSGADTSSVPAYLLTLRVAGEARLSQNNRTALIRQGDFSLYDASKPVMIESDREYSSLCMRIPRRLVELPSATVDELTAVPLSAEKGLGPVIASIFFALDRAVDAMSTDSRCDLETHVIGLVNTMLRERLEEHSTRLDAYDDAALRQRVYRYIEGNLVDVELSPERIAAAHFISTRTLHNLFVGEKQTVSRWIRARRLERAYDDLADPRSASVPVATIARRCGFEDASYFGHLFKERTGRTPTEFRREIHGTAAHPSPAPIAGAPAFGIH